MGLMGLTKGIKPCIAYLLDARTYLFWGKSVTIAQEVFVFASAVDESGRAIEKELPAPLDLSDAKRRAHLVGSLAVTLNHRTQTVEVRVFKAPTMDIRDLLSTSESLGLAGE